MIERQRFVLSENFSGNWQRFVSAIKNPETIYVYDIDGILSDSAKKVFEDFAKTTGIVTSPAQMTGWDFLTDLAKSHGLSDDLVAHAEDAWYDPNVLFSAERNLFIRPVVAKTVSLSGPERNFVLTSRKSNLHAATDAWLKVEFPMFLPENIWVPDNDDVSGGAFKAVKLALLAHQAPYVVFIDDSTKYIKAALDAGIPNLLAVNVPQGLDMPEFTHEGLYVAKRYPECNQGIYTLYKAIETALSEY